MKKFLFFAAAAVAALVTSCNKEQATQDFEEVSIVYATFAQDNATKVVMGESDGTNTPLNWNQGDKIVVVNANDFSYGAYQTASSVQDGDSRAEFVLVEGTQINPSVPHFAVYPCELISPDTYSFHYKSEQAYVENSFDPAQMPLVAKNTSGNTFTFKAQAAVVRLKVSTTTSDVKVTSIELSSATNALTGFADANLTTATYGVPVRSTGKTTKLVCPAGGVAINGTAKEFNIVVPGQTYPSGDLTITVKTNKGNIVKTSKAAATFVAGKVYNINVSGDPTPALPAETSLWEGATDINWGDSNVQLSAAELATVPAGAKIVLTYEMIEADYHALRVTNQDWSSDLVAQVDEINVGYPDGYEFVYTADCIAAVGEGSMVITGFGYRLTKVSYIVGGAPAETTIWEGDTDINWGDSNVQISAEDLSGVAEGSTIVLAYEIIEADYHALRVTNQDWSSDLVAQVDEINVSYPDGFEFVYTADCAAAVGEGAMVITGFGYKLTKVTVK